MSHNNLIKNLLNIKDKNFKVLKISEEEIKGIKNKVTYSIFSKKKYSCIHCNSKNTIKNGFKNINIKISKISEFYARIKIKKQRYFCKECNKSFSLDLSFVSEKSNISKNLKLAVKLALKDNRSEKNIAKEYNISPSTVDRIVDKCLNYKPNYDYLPKQICFDEFKSTKDADGAMSFIFAMLLILKLLILLKIENLINLKKL